MKINRRYHNTLISKVLSDRNEQEFQTVDLKVKQKDGVQFRYDH